MELSTFFQKFDQFADAPDAIGTLREVILQLAVSGRLVSQSKTDAPVDVGRLDEQAAPRKQAEGRSGASLEAVTEDEIAEEIPDSWAWVRLFRLCESDAPIVYGILQPGPDVRPNGVPYVRPTEIKGGQIRLSEIRHTSPEIATQYTRATIRKGDVLLTIVGTLGATAVVPEELDGGNITQSSCRLRPDSRFIDTSYLVICLRARTLLNQYRGFSLGSAVQRLNIAHVRALAIPLPPLAEQKRIVAKVDELMALCDRLEAQQQERATKHAALARASLARFADAPIVSNLKFLFHESYSIPPADLRKSIFTLAVQGKLVPQDPNDEPAEALLERIRKARRALAENGEVKTKVQLAPIGPDQEPYSIPDTWLWVPLNEVTELVYGKLLPTTELLPEGFQVFGANGIIGRFSKYLYEDEMLLISCRGAYSGTPNISPLKCYVTNNSIVCEFFEPSACDIRFFHSVISISPREKIVTGSAQPQVTVANAIKLPVPLPPLAEQRRIVAKVEQLMALVDALAQQLAASRATGENLLSALVAELTGTPSNGKASVPSASTTGRRGRPRKSP